MPDRYTIMISKCVAHGNIVSTLQNSKGRFANYAYGESALQYVAYYDSILKYMYACVAPGGINSAIFDCLKGGRITDKSLVDLKFTYSYHVNQDFQGNDLSGKKTLSVLTPN